MARPKKMAKKMGNGNLHEAAQKLIDVPIFTKTEILQKSPHICAICDEGGELIICDGLCHRQFHASINSEGAGDYNCPSVNFSIEEDGGFICPDCMENQARCFKCHIVGDIATQIRQCPSDFCARWYCFTCLTPEASACNLHRCQTCTQASCEDGIDMVQCMRCPSA